ncbi:MAG TPA: hypothetical protein VKA34_02500 [Balneolales bacterium]|nr:hypothetical protein [Balneolales bacterium]
MLVLISGRCVTTKSIPVSKRGKIFNQQYNKTFREVVRVFTNRGYSIDKMDRISGLINTDYKNASTL